MCDFLASEASKTQYTLGDDMYNNAMGLYHNGSASDAFQMCLHIISEADPNHGGTLGSLGCFYRAGSGVAMDK